MPAFSNFGETLALITAIVWSISVILFKKSGETVRPLGLNLFKNTLTLLLVPPTMLVLGESLFAPAPLMDYVLLLFSGVLGIGIADTLFFWSLNLLGAARSAIVDCLYSPVIILLSIFWLDERLTITQAAAPMSTSTTPTEVTNLPSSTFEPPERVMKLAPQDQQV